MKRYPDLGIAIADITTELWFTGSRIHTGKWQGNDISKRPEAEMVELTYVDLHVPLYGEDVQDYRDLIKPNLPFADLAFEERVSGIPMNPGEAWKSWPWAQSANRHRSNEVFEHTYQERYWPKGDNRVGIRFHYGDLDDMVKQLAHDPLTRQAYLPVFFPEDTGYTGRKPCTLGYLFLMRNNMLDITYYIRSCDLYRHFRDDIYMTIRLLLWVLNKCRELNPDVWRQVMPGCFRMDIGSLHVFVNDFRVLFKEIQL